MEEKEEEEEKEKESQGVLLVIANQLTTSQGTRATVPKCESLLQCVNLDG